MTLTAMTPRSFGAIPATLATRPEAVACVTTEGAASVAIEYCARPEVSQEEGKAPVPLRAHSQHTIAAGHEQRPSWISKDLRRIPSTKPSREGRILHSGRKSSLPKRSAGEPSLWGHPGATVGFASEPAT